MTVVESSVAVIITSFNSAKTILRAIKSVDSCETSFPVEIFVYDDGSQDESQKLIEDYTSRVPMHFFAADENQGRPYGLIHWLDRINHDFVAILDSDDVTNCKRLEEQVSFLNRNPSIDVIGGQTIKFGDWGYAAESTTYPSSPSDINDWLRKGRNPFAHSTVMFRLAWYRQIRGYDENFDRSLDYELFLRGIRTNNYFNSNEVYAYYFSNEEVPSFDYWIQTRKARDRAMAKNGIRLPVYWHITRRLASLFGETLILKTFYFLFVKFRKESKIY